MVSRRRTCAALVGGLTALFVAAADADPTGSGEVPSAAASPCHSVVLIEPPTAVVGEQVRYRIRILRRPDVVAVRWLRAPTFPSLRSEWLPGRTPDPRIAGVGAGLLVVEERRALFPATAGTLEIPSAQLGCALADDAEFAAEVPPTSLRVDPLPEAGRPDDFSGVVGAVRVRTQVSTAVVSLGDSFALAISLTGTANVWAADSPLDPARDLPGVDAYPRTPELEFERGELLSARRTFVWDLVPRSSGTLQIPPARVSYFDPGSQRYGRAAGPPLSIEVLASAGPGGAPRDDRASAASAPDGTPGPWRAWGLRALVVLLGGGAIAAIAARARRRHAPLQAAAAALEQAESAAARGDLDATARALATALRAALAMRMAGAGSLPVEELVARAPARGPAFETAAGLLAALDRARFAPPGSEVSVPTPETVRSAVRALGSTRNA